MLFRELIYRKKNHRRLKFFKFKNQTNHSLSDYLNVIASALEV